MPFARKLSVGMDMRDWSLAHHLYWCMPLIKFAHHHGYVVSRLAMEGLNPKVYLSDSTGELFYASITHFNQGEKGENFHITYLLDDEKDEKLFVRNELQGP